MYITREEQQLNNLEQLGIPVSELVNALEVRLIAREDAIRAALAEVTALGSNAFAVEEVDLNQLRDILDVL